MNLQNRLTPELVVDRLIEMGYLKFASYSECSIAREELVASFRQGYIGTEWNDDCVSRDKRTYPADSEELAEGRTSEFILLMRYALSLDGVHFESVEDEFEDDHYDVVIDGHHFPVWDNEILKISNSWGIATKRFLEIVNGLLDSAGSNERLYGISGGNDGRAILLTAEMYDLITTSGLITNRNELPYPSSAITSAGRFET